MNLEYLARSRSMSDFVDFTFEIKESGGVVVKDMPSQIRSRMWKPHTNSLFMQIICPLQVSCVAFK